MRETFIVVAVSVAVSAIVTVVGGPLWAAVGFGTLAALVLAASGRV
jgi:hypothetical protein